MATNASLGPDAHPSKDERPTRGRDGRKTAQNDDSAEQDNKVTQTNPPNHSNAAQKGSPAKFLQWLHPDTPLTEDTLARKWEYWYPRDMDTESQPREDTEPKWSANWGECE